MIQRRQFLTAAGIAALAPIARPAAGVLPSPPAAPPLLASSALALLLG